MDWLEKVAHAVTVVFILMCSLLALIVLAVLLIEAGAFLHSVVAGRGG